MFQRINRYIPGSVYIYIYMCVCVYIYIYIYIHTYICGIDRHVPGSGYVLREAGISTRKEGEFLKRCQLPQGINRCHFIFL